MDEIKQCPVSRARYSAHSSQIDKSESARKSASNGGVIAALNCSEHQTTSLSEGISNLSLQPSLLEPLRTTYSDPLSISPLRDRSEPFLKNLQKQIKNIKVSQKEYKNNLRKRNQQDKFAKQISARKLFDNDPLGTRFLTPYQASRFDAETYPDAIFSNNDLHEYRPLFVGWQDYLSDTNTELKSKGLPLLSAHVFVKPKDYKLPKYRNVSHRRESRFKDRVFSDFSLDEVKEVSELETSGSNYKRAQRALHNALEKAERLKKQMAKHARRIQNVVDVLNVETEFDPIITESSLVEELPQCSDPDHERRWCNCYPQERPECSSPYHSRGLCTCHYDLPQGADFDTILEFLSDEDLDWTGISYISYIKKYINIITTDAWSMLLNLWEKIKEFFQPWIRTLGENLLDFNLDFQNRVMSSPFNQAKFAICFISLWWSISHGRTLLYAPCLWGVLHCLTGENFLLPSKIKHFIYYCALMNMLFPSGKKKKKKNKNKNKKVEVEIVTEGEIADFLQSILVTLNGVLECSMIQGIKDIILKLLSLRAFPKEYRDTIIKTIGTPQKATVGEVIIDMSKLGIDLIRSLELWKAGFPLLPSLLASDPIGKFIADSRELLAYRDFLYVGLPVEHKMCRTEFAQRIGESIQFIDTTLKTLPRSHSSYRSLGALHLDLKKAQISISSELCASQRAVPYAVLIVGPPGTGKSRLVQHIACANAQVRNRPFYPNEIYVRNVGVKYFEMYDMLSHKVIVYPELGNASENISKTTQDAAFVEVLGVVDNNPYPVDMAFEGKGKTFALPELVIAHTNNEELNAKFQVMNAAAYYRRFNLIIRASVKEKYRMPNSVMLDVEKALADSSDAMDRFLYDVVRKIPKGNKTYHEDPLLLGANIYQLTTFLERDMENHIRIQEAVINKTADPTFYHVYRDKEEEHVEEVITEGFFDNITVLDKITDYCVEKLDAYTYGAIDLVISVLGSFAAAFIWKKLIIWQYSPAAKYISYITYILVMRVFMYFTYGNFGYTYVLIIFLLMFHLSCPTLLTVYIYVLTKCKWSPGHAQKFAVKREIMKTPCISNSQFNALFLPSYSHTLINILQSIVLIASGYIAISSLYNYTCSNKVTPEKEESELSNKYDEAIVSEATLSEHERNMECGISYKKIQAARAHVWNVQVDIPRPQNTLSLPQLTNLVYRNVRGCQFVPLQGVKQRAYILGLKGNWALCNRHLFGLSSPYDCKLLISSTEQKATEQNAQWNMILPGSCHEISSDLIMFQIGSYTFRNIVEHILPARTDFPTSCDGMFENNKIKTEFQMRKWKIKDRFVENKYYIHDGLWVYPSTFGKGKCGLPIIIEHGRGCSIVGIHSGGHDISENNSHEIQSMGFAQMISQKDLIFSSNNMHVPIMSEGIDLHVEHPIHKSVFCYENLETLTYYGKLPGPVLAKGRSRMKRMIDPDILSELFLQSFDFIPSVQYVKPLMNPKVIDNEYVSPWNTAVRSMQTESPPPNYVVLDKVIDVLTNRIVDGLRKKGVSSLAPLTSKVAINGVAHDPFIRRINVSTSGGIGWSGAKSEFLPIVDETDWIVRQPVEELELAISRIFDKYKNGETVNPLFQASLKDEPRDFKKFLAGKTRVFYGAPLDYLIVSRMMIAPIYSLMTEHSELFCTGIGINTRQDSHSLVTELLEFSPFIIDGDIKNFDLKMPYWIREAEKTLTYRIGKEFGYSEEACYMLSGVLTDSLHPTISLLKDIFSRAGLQPSGQYGTAEANSNCLLLALLYIWYSDTRLIDLDFFQHVLPYTYGDDLLAAIKENIIHVFNNKMIQEGFDQLMGVTYTAGDKSHEVKLYSDIHSVTFLKRSFVKRGDQWIMPLDLNSCYKMLEWFIPSDSCPISTQVLSTLSSCLWEVYLHLPEKEFNIFRTRLIDIFRAKYDLTTNDITKLPTWDVIDERTQNKDVPLSIGVWEEDTRGSQERQQCLISPEICT